MSQEKWIQENESESVLLAIRLYMFMESDSALQPQKVTHKDKQIILNK